MKNHLITFIISVVFIISCKSTKKVNLSEINSHFNKSEAKVLLETLSSDDFLGRKPGTIAYEKTVSYVTTILKSNNISPFYKSGYRDTCFVNSRESYNIVALIGDRDRTKKHILLGAHLDHLGISERTKEIYNGANDNASGVTAVLQIAKELNKYNFDQNIIIVLFTGEESGLIGSKHLAKRLKNEKVNLSYMLNFEMIGKTLTSGKDQVYLTGFNKSNCSQEINKIMNSKFATFLPEAITYDLFYRSDNISFYREFNIPSHTISTFDFKNYKHYHKVSDEVSKLDIENLNQIIISSTFFISQLLYNNTELTNTPSKRQTTH